MSVPAAIRNLFGRRKGRPNISDKSSPVSVDIATGIFEGLRIDRRSNEAGQTLGSRFEKAVLGWIDGELHSLAPGGGWLIGAGKITEFSQYEHLRRVRELIDADDTGTLRAELGTEYLIKPDITVGLKTEGVPFLHAAISCKWTIRSDRVQNIRHEGVILTSRRRGRQPHIVTVTTEPLPSRLAAIARGTGEVDCVYHATLKFLQDACPAGKEADILDELISQDRLRSLDALPVELARF